jgi:hypothetical protein
LGYLGSLGYLALLGLLSLLSSLGSRVRNAHVLRFGGSKDKGKKEYWKNGIQERWINENIAGYGFSE